MGGLRGGGKQTDVWWNSNPPPISFSFSALLLLCICLIIISRLPFTFSFFSFCTYVNCIVFSENVIINLNVLNTKKKAWKKLVYLESVCHRVPWRPAASGPPPALFQHTNCLMRDRRGKWRADDPDWLFHPSASCHSFCHVLRKAVVARVTIAAVWGRVTHPGHVAPPSSPTVSITLTCASLDSRRNFWRTCKLHTESSQALETNPGHHNVAQDGYGTRTYRLLRCGNTVSF